MNNVNNELLFTNIKKEPETNDYESLGLNCARRDSHNYVSLFTVPQKNDTRTRDSTKTGPKENRICSESNERRAAATHCLPRWKLICAAVIIFIVVVGVTLAVCLRAKTDFMPNPDIPPTTPTAATTAADNDWQSKSSAAPTKTTTTNVPTKPLEPAEWAPWGHWTTCSVTCGSGVYVRYRTCNKTKPEDADCEGQYVQQDVCSVKTCPVYGKWITWSSWSTCDVSCGGGIQTRSRVCQKAFPDAIDCIGNTSMQQTCGDWDCPDCSKQCTIGTLNDACDTCICASTILEGRLMSSFDTPIDRALFKSTTAPTKIIAESNFAGFFSLNSTCLLSSIIVSREGFQDKEVLINETYNIIYMDLEVLPRITEQPQSKVRIAGEDVYFCCSAFSAPKITYYEWFHNTVLIDKTMYKNNGTTLFLSSVQPIDSGDYTCRASNAQRAVMSIPAILSVRDTEDGFCIDALKQKKIALPSSCTRQGRQTAFYEVGDCISKSCRQGSVNNTKECNDIIKSSCVPSKFETKSIDCTDYKLQIFVVKACSCGTRIAASSLRVSGKVVSAKSSSPIKYVEVWVNGKFVTFTTRLGSFSVSVSNLLDKVVFTLKDTFNKVYLDSTKVMRITSGVAGIFSINISMLEIPPPTQIDSSVVNKLGMSTTNNSASPVASINIPANSFFRTNGSEYSGKVFSMLTFIDPTNNDLRDAIPGTFKFIDNEGLSIDLASKGIFNLQFKDENGEMLYVDNIIDVSFPESTASNFSLWKLNTISGVWEHLLVKTEPNRRKRKSAEYIIGEIDMTEIENTDWLNIDYPIYEMFDNPCYFKTRIYKDEYFLEETVSNYIFYEMEMRRIEQNTLITYMDYIYIYESTTKKCFPASCDEKTGYIRMRSYNDIVWRNSELIAATPLMTETALVYTIVENKTTLGTRMTSSESGPFFKEQAACEAGDGNKSHLRFINHPTPVVFTAYETSPIPTQGLSFEDFLEIQQRVWYPNRENVFTACFIKVAIDLEVPTNPLPDTKLTIQVFSFGGLYSDIRDFLFGIRESKVDIDTLNSVYCIEYKCSGKLEDSSMMDYTRIKIAVESTVAYNCSIKEVKSSLTEYTFGDFGQSNNYWNSPWSLLYSQYFDAFAPADYGGSYGVYEGHTDDISDPETGRKGARNRGQEECMRNHVVHDKGVAVRFQCTVFEK